MKRDELHDLLMRVWLRDISVDEAMEVIDNEPCLKETCEEVAKNLEKCQVALLKETDRIQKAWIELHHLKTPLSINQIKNLATYCPEGFSDEDAIDFARKVEEAHGIVNPAPPGKEE